MTKRRDHRVAYLRINPQLDQEIEARTETGLITMNRVLERDLERYYQLIRRARGEAKSLLSEDEQALIADALNGIIFDAYYVYLLAHNIADSISLDGLDQKWNVDGPALLQKLEAFSPIINAAIVDAVERFWASVGDKDTRKLFD